MEDQWGTEKIEKRAEKNKAVPKKHQQHEPNSIIKKGVFGWGLKGNIQAKDKYKIS